MGRRGRWSCCSRGAITPLRFFFWVRVLLKVSLIHGARTPHLREPRMPLPIEQYALIGDCHTAALIGSDGSIDWLCFPRFDSGACFAALLGGPENGRWLLAPAAESRSVRRRYRGDSLILETDFDTEEGS